MISNQNRAGRDDLSSFIYVWIGWLFMKLFNDMYWNRKYIFFFERYTKVLVHIFGLDAGCIVIQFQKSMGVFLWYTILRNWVNSERVIEGFVLTYKIKEIFLVEFE